MSKSWTWSKSLTDNGEVVVQSFAIYICMGIMGRDRGAGKKNSQHQAKPSQRTASAVQLFSAHHRKQMLAFKTSKLGRRSGSLQGIKG
jgi:hypothetical protein